MAMFIVKVTVVKFVLGAVAYFDELCRKSSSAVRVIEHFGDRLIWITRRRIVRLLFCKQQSLLLAKH